MSETPNLRWFEEYSSCRMCSKRGEGILRGSQNESYGSHCKKHAEQRLKASKAERAKAVQP